MVRLLVWSGRKKWLWAGAPGVAHGRRAGSPCGGRSILITSAPSQASIWVQDGPAWSWVKSMTRMPSSALLIFLSPDCAVSFMLPAPRKDLRHPFWMQEGRSERRMRLSLDVEIDEIDRRRRAFEHAPALQPVEGSLHLFEGNRGGVATHEAAPAKIVDGERRDLRIIRAVVIDEVVEVGALVGIDAPHRFAHRAVERGIGLGGH